MLTVKRGDETIKTYQVAVGQPRYPTPPGTYDIRKIVWNPSWTPPPDAAWARGKTAKGPGEPGNPMKVAKIFFKEPDYYIHGTDQIESLGSNTIFISKFEPSFGRPPGPDEIHRKDLTMDDAEALRREAPSGWAGRS